MPAKQVRPRVIASSAAPVSKPGPSMGKPECMMARQGASKETSPVTTRSRKAATVTAPSGLPSGSMTATTSAPCRASSGRPRRRVHSVSTAAYGAGYTPAPGQSGPARGCRRRRVAIVGCDGLPTGPRRLRRPKQSGLPADSGSRCPRTALHRAHRGVHRYGSGRVGVTVRRFQTEHSPLAEKVAQLLPIGKAPQ